MTSNFLNQQRVALLIALSVLVASIYMITYSGRIESSDTLFMFDATGSFVRHGDFRLDLTAGERRFWNYEEPLPEIPPLRVDAEPLQLILASPLYWLAEQLPQLGRVHSVWMFNIIVTTVAVAVFYLYALALNYDDLTAVVAAMFFGLGTIVWAYSKTFFQEPLTLLLILSTALLTERWRQTHYRGIVIVLTAVIVFVLAVLARRAAIIALPVFVIIGFPYLDTVFRPFWRRKLFLLLVVITGGLLYYNSLPQSAQEVSRWYRQVEHIAWYDRMVRASMNQGIQGYLFAPGGSIWGTSPVLLLSVPGTLMLARRNQMRYVIVAFTMLLLYALIYAYGSNFNWFGGLSWPPRFMIPVVPFFMLMALPFIEYLCHLRWAPRFQAAWAVAIVLLLYSLWIQFNAVSYWWGEYVNLLPVEANGFTEWYGGLNDVRYFRWVLLPQLWGQIPFDFAWVRTDVYWLPIAYGLLAVLSTIVIYIKLCHWSEHVAIRLATMVGLPITFVGITAVGLWAMYQDDLYLAFSNGLWRAAEIIEDELDDDDVVIISDLGHERFFLNYGDIGKTRLISLPEHPGEQPGPDQLPQVHSPHPVDLLEKPTVQLIDTLAQTHDRLWILADTSPFITYAVRPLERYMAQTYYPVRSIDTTGDDGLPVRLIEYSTVVHHEPYTIAGARYSYGLMFW